MQTNLKDWCIENSKEELLEQWNYERNSPLSPNQCTPGSGKKVWWRCRKGHEWESPIGVRTSGSSCPYCSGRRVIPGETDLATINPKIALEWHPVKNEGITPRDVKAGTHRKAWWLCPQCGHEWQATISSRGINGNGCPECGKRKISKSRQTPKAGQSLLERCPDIAAEWNYSKNGALKPEDVPARSSHKVWWICAEKHEWVASVSNRAGGRGCPICSNRIIEAGFNSLAVLNPELAAEWHPSKNEHLTPYAVAPSSNRKVWWMCERGHEWQATINNRVKRGCPECSKARRVSFPEKAIFFYTHQQYQDAVENYRPNWLNGREIDVFIPSIQTGIEYDGEQFHRDIRFDIEKDCLCERNGVRLIRVREPECPKLEKQKDVYCLKNRSEKELEAVICNILQQLNSGAEGMLKLPEINIAADRSEIYDLIGYIERESALSSTHPQLAKEWHPTKNGTLTPDKVTKGSDKVVWWMCEKGHIWDTSISHRVSGHKCPICSNKRVVAGQNDFQTLYPDLMEEWDWEKNTNISPEKQGKSSAEKAWWKCRACGGLWQASLISRADGAGCPECLAKRYSEEYSRPDEEQSLAVMAPLLASQWHPEMNGDMMPKDVFPGSHKSVWWLCEKGHKWQAQINSRYHGSNCPICSNRQLLQGYNDLATTAPDVAAWWHPILNGKDVPQTTLWGSNKKVWWKCRQCGHEFQRSVAGQMKSRRCPSCKSRADKKG